jgi:assimilatory nitrate reductase catalytic subunit
VRRAVPPPGQARDDWQIAVDVAQRLEQRLPSRRVAAQAGRTLFPYDSAESVWAEHRETTRRRDLDITGLSWGALDTPQQWPCAEGATAGTARLYTDHRFATPDGRARFVAPAWRPVADARDARFPVALTTGRLRDQWHGMSRTGTLGRLFAHAAEPTLDLHPQDLQRRHWRDGDLVRVQSRRGTLVLPVRGSESVAPMQAFIAMHWGPEWLGGGQGGGVNALTSGAFCPRSKQPELKHAAVRIEAAVLPWQLVAAAWLPEDRALDLLTQLRSEFGHYGFASAMPFGREPQPQVGVLFRAAATGPVDAACLARVEHLLGLDAGPVLRYADARAGQHRAMRLADGGSLQAFMLAGNAAAQGWVLDLLQQGGSAVAFGRALLAASAAPAQAVAARSPQVCACFDVSEARIAAAAPGCHGHAEQRLQTLQAQLKCGTQCGSCLPALKGLLQRHPAAQGVPA